MENTLLRFNGGKKTGNEALAGFLQLCEKYPARVIAEKMGLHANTVQRWLETNNVPRHYAADLRRMWDGGIVVGNAKESDQYYTKKETAAYCYKQFAKTAEKLNIDLAKYRFIEPSAGCGGFYDILPPRRRIGIDINPRRKGLIAADYLRWTPAAKNKKYAVVGNPPFGLRGHMALQFINHSAAFADLVAFILPQLFDSDGKGATGKRVRGYTLAHSEKLPLNSFQYPDGKEVPVATVFQVWTKINTDKIRRPKLKTCKSFIRVYSLSNGGTPATTRNKNMLQKCDVYLPSTCFSGMRAYPSFESLPNRRGYGVVIFRQKQKIKKILQTHDWTKTAFLSTNSALNLRRSLIENAVINSGCRDS